MSVKDLTFDLVIRYGFQVLGAIVILAVGFVLARWAGNLAQQWLVRQDMEPPVRTLIVRVIKILVLAFTLLIVLDKLGVQITPLIAGIGVAGLGIGIAMQGVLSNVMAGLTIIFTKPYRVGEYIDIVGEQGHVSTIDILSTILEHPDRSRVVIPNRKIVGEILHNFGTIRQFSLTVGVAYDTDLNKAMAILRDLVATNPRVLKDPAPGVGIKTLADSAIVLSISAWTKVPDYGAAQGELYQAIVEQFRAANIDIPFPQLEVRMVTGS
jgi:small conductance mechanosensitive channel